MDSCALKSMTGFGRSTFSVDGVSYRVQIRTVNHKGLDLRLRLPHTMQPFESDVTRLLRSFLHRGHVDLSVQLEPGGKAERVLTLDDSAVARYTSLWEQVAGETGQALDIRWLLSQDGVYTNSLREIPESVLQGALVQAIEDALHVLTGERKREGEALTTVFKGRLDALRGWVKAMKVLNPALIEERQESMRRKMNQTGELDLESQTRLEEELLLIADRMDVDEEITRLEAHMTQIECILNGEVEGPLGKRFGFLAQELMREATTAASKAGNEEMSSLSVHARVEVERIREQLMNVE